MRPLFQPVDYVLMAICLFIWIVAWLVFPWGDYKSPDHSSEQTDSRLVGE